MPLMLISSFGFIEILTKKLTIPPEFGIFPSEVFLSHYHQSLIYDELQFIASSGARELQGVA
jgi:hypothetical protein